MDTTLASPKRYSPKAPGLLTIALSVGVGLWLVTASAGLASAQAAPQTSARVTYADLDLSTRDGASALLKRINVAARTACGQASHSPLLPREGAHIRACVTDAVDTAVSHFDAPLVAALHNKRAPGGVTLAAR